MFQLWGKIYTNQHLIKDITFETSKEDTMTHLIFKGLTHICEQLDISQPIWLEGNVKDFQQYMKTRFYKDSFIEEIDFDYLEIQLL